MFILAQAATEGQKAPEPAKDQLQIITETVQTFAAEYGLKIIGAIVILIVGRLIAKVITKIIKASMIKAKAEPTLVTFAENLVYMALLGFVIIAALASLGVQTNSMIAVIGAAGLAVGLALQGALSNFAASVLIMVFRPYKVDDLIEAGGSLGFVRAIELFTTTLVTLDNKTVIIPNSQMTASSITNLTETDELRMDLVFGVSYSDDIDKVKEICMKVMKGSDLILKTPEPFVGVLEHGDSSVNFAVRPWVHADHYWDVYFYMHEEVKKAFDREGVSIPFPQRDLHIVSDATK
ncbi:MAG: mechanosensitive ion channel [Lentisphaeraceae bacterium]|nr:mechanosensitive ion channel [Lentisphaeraceae bacterium]